MEVLRKKVCRLYNIYKQASLYGVLGGIKTQRACLQGGARVDSQPRKDNGTIYKKKELN